MDQRWRERPWREDFSLTRSSVNVVERDDEDETVLPLPLYVAAVVAVAFDAAYKESCGCWAPLVTPCSSSELKTKSVLTTSNGGSFCSTAPTAVSFSMAPRSHDEAEDAVTTVEFDDVKGFTSDG